MNIIAHRGFWTRPEDKNTIEAFSKAFNSGYGVETDIRDDRGKIVISHDMPTGSEIPLSDFLALLKGRNLPIALNIKSDGLIQPLKEALEKFKVENFFTFDMSFPESRRYIKQGLFPFISLSEFHPTFSALKEYEGIWLDSFESQWFGTDSIVHWLDAAQVKRICIVSPELHGRPHINLWEKLKLDKIHHCKHMAICTDFPDEANHFFNRNDL
jgi:hypothetical protein